VRRRQFTALAGAAAVAAPLQAFSQARWKPDKPITIYNPFAAGGVTDVHMRLLGEIVGKILGQQIVIDIKPGAAGTLAPAMLLNAKPDGQTLAVMSINTLRYPHYQQTTWNPLTDFTYITGLSGYTMGIVVRTDSPWKTFEDMIGAGKKEPDKYNYGTSGVGGTGQLMMIEVEQATGAKFTHVPYKGGAEWMQALMGGEIQFIADAAQWAPFVDDGKCRILAFATEQRIPRYKDVPTMIELGVKVVGQSPYGLLGPKGMPPEIVESLYQAFKQASADPKVTEYLAKFIQVPWEKNPTEFRAFAEKYYVDVKPLLIKAGLAKS
jgi:tripartite-type tricarboxylate transporter receptor subunit TctC